MLLFLVSGEINDLVGHSGADRERGRLLLLELGDGFLGELLALLEHDRAGLRRHVRVGELVGDLRIVERGRALDLAIGRLDEAVLVDPAVGGERADQADVRTFRRLDRADAAVVAVVHVADVEAGALAREAARAKGRQAALGGQLGERVGLVHELRQLAAAEELLHRRDHGADVDQRVGRRLLRFLDRHALAHDALHAQQADPERVLDQLAIGADAAVAEVVDVVRRAHAVVQLDQVADDGGDVLLADRPLAGQRDAHPVGDRAELLVDLVAADAAEVVAAEVEEQALDQLLGVVTGRRVARAQLLVDLDQRFLTGVGAVLLERAGDVGELARVDTREDRADLVVALVADGTEQLGRLQLALAIDLDVQLAAGGSLELEPRATVRDDLGVVQHSARGRILDAGVVHARRADELADHDALGAVDDERAFLGHEREVAHVHALALDLAGLLDEQLDPYVERLRVGQVTRAALQLGVLGRLELVLLEAELHDPAGEVLDGADLVEQLAQATLDEPVERLQLELDQVRDGQDFGDACVALALK